MRQVEGRQMGDQAAHGRSLGTEFKQKVWLARHPGS